MPEKVEALAKTLINADERGEIKEYIYVYDEKSDRRGAFGVAENTFLDEEGMKAAYYMDCVATYMGKRPRFLYKEIKPLEELSEIKIYERVTVWGKPDLEKEGVTVFYYDLDGSKGYITNCVIRGSHGEYMYYNSNMRNETAQ